MATYMDAEYYIERDGVRYSLGFSSIEEAQDYWNSHLSKTVEFSPTSGPFKIVGVETTIVTTVERILY